MPLPNYHGLAQIAVQLWRLLDDIDTLDDACRDDHEAFRRIVRSVQRRRFDLMSEKLFEMLSNPAQLPNVSGETVVDEEMKLLLELVDAAVVWAFCPSAGGYRDGPAVEDTCESLGGAVRAYLGIEDTDTPPDEWWTLEEMRAAISKVSTRDSKSSLGGTYEKDTPQS